MWAHPVGIERTAVLDRSAVRVILGLAVALILTASPALVGPAALPRDQPLAGWSSQGGAVAEPVPASPAADVPADWWAAVQEDLRQSEYRVTWQEQTALADGAAAFQAPNRAQNLRTYFTPAGIRIIPRSFEGEAPPWQWGLVLTGYGVADSVQPVEAARLEASGNRIDYRRGALTEWYVNDERGLEQGFTLHSPPVGGNHGTDAILALEMALSGSLTANLTAAGDALELTTPGGVRVLRYDSLLVTDATGRKLPAHFELLEPAGQQTLRVVVDAEGAVYPITVDPLATSPAWTAESDQAGANFGWSVSTAGDVNGDGFGDVIVGAYLYDNDVADEGRAFVYHGSAAGLSASASWTAEGAQGGAYFGWSVATAGDVNGDGYSDVIVGEPLYDNGHIDEGRAFVYHGSAAGLSASANWTAEGNQHEAYFGWSVATAGDINGGGFSDVIVGIPGIDSGQTNEGMVYMYRGSAGGLSAFALWWAESDQAGAAFGWSVATAGDVNGDGYSDVIVGAPRYDNGQDHEGRAFVYHGSPTGLSASANWTAESDQGDAQFGYSVATAGDVNGDGYGDVLVGAYLYDNGQADEGRAFVYHGSAAGLSASASWTAESDQASAKFGWSVSTAGDVNGDGFGDVIVGAPRYDNGQADEGRAFVYHGSAAGLSASASWTAEGIRYNAQFGYSVATAGDVNGDGYSDVIVGAPLYDNGQTDEGRTFVYPGSAAGLSASVNWMAESDQASAFFGASVATAGDVNGDGYGDVVVGAYLYDNGQTNEGRAFVYHGSAGGLSTTANWTAESNQSGAQFGYSVATAGDVNGDGYGDVVVGATWYDNGQTNEGRAFVYHGSPTGLSASANWTAESDQGDAQFGISVTAAGDVNGDGYGDVIVGAYLYDNGQINEGRAYLYQGSAAGLSASANWTVESDQGGAYFGWSVATAGDVNRDGFSDVIVGAYLYDNGQSNSNEGRAFVYHGSPAGLSATANWTAESGQAGAQFGYSVATAGDVNGDGYADVFVGAPYCDNGQTDEGRAYVYHGSPTGLSATANWTAESGQAGAQFGYSVATAGDVNGDGYSDVVVGTPLYDNVQTDEGAAFVYHGSAGGLSASANWTAESNQANAYFGRSVATAGDVNGDGYADVVVGAPYYDNGQTDEGGAFVYYGNGGDGLDVRPQQRRADDSAPVAVGGQVHSPDQARLAALLRTPFGRNDVALQWEIKSEGTAFDGSGLGQSTWMDSGVAGASISQLVSGLAFETRYHWRVRILGRPLSAATNSAIAYRSRWLYGTAFLTALNGQQAIGGTGQTNLLGQTAYVNVSNLGSPPLTSLAVVSYPNTEPPYASSVPGGVIGGVLARYFSLEPNAGADGYYVTLCLNYEDSEVAAVGITESNMELCRFSQGWRCMSRSATSDTGANLVCADDVIAFSNWAIASGGPLAVTLSGFEAEAQAGQVLVTWETAAELDNAGFNLYRGLQADGGDRALLAHVPSQSPGGSQGFSYSYLDTAVEPGQTVWYWLDDVDLAGATTLHGPVSATLQTPTAVGLVGFEAVRSGKRSIAGLVLVAGLAVVAGGWSWRQRRRALR